MNFAECGYMQSYCHVVFPFFSGALYCLNATRHASGETSRICVLTLEGHKRLPHCLSASVDPEGAEEQPDRVVFVEDLKPLLFRLSQPSSLR